MRNFNFTRLAQITGLASFSLSLRNTSQEKINTLYKNNSELKAQIEALKQEIASKKDKALLEEQFNEINNSINKLNTKIDKIPETFNKVLNSKSIENASENVEKVISLEEESTNNVLKVLEKINDLNDNNSKFIDSNTIDNLFNNINSLSYDDNLIFLHLVGSLVIFVSLFSIISIFYGNFLIEYFKLAERYPKLKFYIDMRLKFQHYYLWFNFFSILFVLIGIVVVNVRLII